MLRLRDILTTMLGWYGIGVSSYDPLFCLCGHKLRGQDIVYSIPLFVSLQNAICIEPISFLIHLHKRCEIGPQVLFCRFEGRFGRSWPIPLCCCSLPHSAANKWIVCYTTRSLLDSPIHIPCGGQWEILLLVFQMLFRYANIHIAPASFNIVVTLH